MTDSVADRVRSYFWAIPPDPNWVEWNLRPLVSAYETAALSFGLDPDIFASDEGIAVRYAISGEEERELLTAHRERAESLMRAIAAGSLGESVRHGATSLVSSVRAVQWLRQVGVDVPKEWTPLQTKPSGGWPWGDYETLLLRHLDAAVRRYWVNYNPNDPTTANTKPVVVEWLKKECGCTQNQAEAIDLILRPKDLKPGPRT